jgi:hypothetical protein
MAEMCDMVYPRGGDTIPCTYIKGHPKNKHSWEALRLQDEVDAAARRAWVDSDTPSDVLVLLSNIKSGAADQYLEAILSVCHNRKRALRGVRVFDELLGS